MQADFAHKIPDGLDSASAAPLLCAGITVYAPLRAHVTRPNMSVAVMGVGGLGHLALQVGARSVCVFVWGVGGWVGGRGEAGGIRACVIVCSCACVPMLTGEPPACVRECIWKVD